MKKDGENKFASDLACERARAEADCDGIEFQRQRLGGLVTERVLITSEAGERRLKRPKGSYFTLHTGSLEMLTESEAEDAREAIARELCELLYRMRITPARLLVVGLGARELTPDSVGPRTASLVSATMHREDVGEAPKVAVISPDVTARTGMLAFDTVVGICERIHPDAIIAVDSLACSSHTRLGSCIQISDTGIFPGSGVGEGTYPLNAATVGIPVIAIGTPTILRATVVESGGEGVESMLVCPRQIDAITDTAARIIAGGINQAFSE